MDIGKMTAKIHYSFSKIQPIFGKKNKYGLSLWLMTDMFFYCEYGLAAFFAGTVCLLLILSRMNEKLILVPIALFALVVYFIHRYIRNRLWDEKPVVRLSAEEEKQTDVVLWIIVGFMLYSFFLFLLGGGILMLVFAIASIT